MWSFAWSERVNFLFVGKKWNWAKQPQQVHCFLIHSPMHTISVLSSDVCDSITLHYILHFLFTECNRGRWFACKSVCFPAWSDNGGASCCQYVVITAMKFAPQLHHPYRRRMYFVNARKCDVPGTRKVWCIGESIWKVSLLLSHNSIYVYIQIRISLPKSTSIFPHISSGNTYFSTYLLCISHRL